MRAIFTTILNRDKLFAYTASLSIYNNDDVMNANNPLLVVNNKVNLNRPPVERMDGGQPHKTVVEANVEVNNIRLQRNANYN